MRIKKSNQGPGRKKESLLAMCAHFSALALEDRLQFLSWLFEGALSHCAYLPLNANHVSSPLTSPSDHDEALIPTPREFSTSAKVLGSESTSTSRKGLRWSVEEDRLLEKLRVEQKLA
ncbi:hypothetical protein N7540_010971 [Penicillium herquei]|nr:hypothetical protein N7540_010971 [Penicillium herquei]